MDWKLELIVLPVSDIDRAKAFYRDKAGFAVDVDVTVGEDMRIVQLTPPGSACSIVLGDGITASAPGSAQVQIVVGDIEAAHADFAARGLDLGEIQVMPWGRFLFFSDPDGNRWSLQEIPERD